MLPKLQIALDNTDLESALKSVAPVGEVVDVIEVGTILYVAEGSEAVRKLRELYPDKIILADIKAADAGSLLAKLCFDAGASWMTTICCSDINTMIGALKEGDNYPDEKDIQIELYGDWTFDQAAQWRKAGLSQVVYHRSRDAQAAGKDWSDEDLEKIDKLCKMGFKVTVTGGLKIDTIKLFKDYPIYCFIAGRSIRDAADPKQAALDFKKEISKYWE